MKNGLNMTVRRDKRRIASRTALRTYVHEQLKTLWRDCVRAFITEAIQHVHVDTGMSEASFYDLATNVKLGSAVIANIMGKGPNPPRLRYDSRKGVQKSIPLGKELGAHPPKSYKLLFGAPNQPKLVFEFNIQVYQYKLYEYGYTDKRTGKVYPAWESLEHGRQAFITCWNLNFARKIKTLNILDFLAPKVR